MSTPRHTNFVLITLTSCLLAVPLAAQYQVNRQLGSASNLIYGGPSSGSIRYNSVPMPSEARYAARASGLLPSELRMNAHAVGPIGSGYVNPSYRPATPHSWGAQPSSLGTMRYNYETVRPATVNPYLTSRSIYR